jgi:ElaB/YqjD/DUF883 family membrane-anchored ribosome-binding protein
VERHYKKSKEALMNAAEDSQASVQRFTKRARHAAADYADDTAYRVKKNPFASLAIAFAVGAGVAFVAGYLAGSARRDGMEEEFIDELD